MSHKRYRIAIVVVFVVIVARRRSRTNGSSPACRALAPNHRQLETILATWLLHQSVPSEAKVMTNPLGSDPADVTAGRDLFGRNANPATPMMAAEKPDRRRPVPASAGAPLAVAINV